jgi:hypothetical protein
MSMCNHDRQHQLFCVVFFFKFTFSLHFMSCSFVVRYREWANANARVGCEGVNGVTIMMICVRNVERSWGAG